MKKKIWIAGAVAAAVLLTALAVPVITTVYAQSQDEHIYEGVYVEDVSLGNMTKEEAQTKVDEYVEQIGTYQVTFQTELGNTSVSLKDLGLNYTNKEIVEEAYSYGKVGNIIKRYKETKDIQQEPAVLKLNKTFNVKKMKAALKEKEAGLVREAKNATVTRANGAFQITPEETGWTINYASNEKKLNTYLNEEWDQESNITLDLTTKEKKPKYTAADFANMTDQIGTFTTNFASSSSDRAANVTNGANLINGSVVYPGEVFSVYDVVAPFTPENGYFIGKAYSNGEVIDSIGGGICQVSTTLYNTVLRAELEVTQRAPHSMVVAYVPLAADAAIAGTYKDLKFKNNTDSPIYIEGSSYNRNITFTIYGHDTRDANRTLQFRSKTLATYQPGKDIETKDPSMEEGKLYVTQSAHMGYKAEYWKDIYIDGKLSESVLVNTSTYQASPRRVTVGSKKKVEEKKPEATTQEPPNGEATTEKPGNTPDKKPDQAEDKTTESKTEEKTTEAPADTQASDAGEATEAE